MLLNNIEMDIKKKCVKARTTQKEIARRIDVSPPYVNHITKSREQIVNITFLKIMDALGYDVELIYKKKNTENDSSIQSK